MNTWYSVWSGFFGISASAPAWIVATLTLICIYGFVIFPCAAAMGYLERKLGADLQARVGPNRAGPAGTLQPFADLLKMLQKQIRTHRSLGDVLWVAVHSMALYSTVAVLPLGSTLLLVDTDLSVFLPFWATLVLAFGTMILGLGQSSMPGWIGGIRVGAQTLAGAFPALICILCVGLRTGSFRWSILANAQTFSPAHWTAVSNPFAFIAFPVFILSGVVVLGISPMDGGVAASLTGRRLAFFRLGRFYGFFLWSVISAVLFLGAWKLPQFMEESLQHSESWYSLAFLELLVLLVKSFLIMLIVVWVGRVNPKLRTEQITDLAWKVLSPFSLAALIGSALWMGWIAL